LNKVLLNLQGDQKQTQIQGTYSFFVYSNDLTLININIMGLNIKLRIDEEKSQNSKFK
jgi:ammonia channel protein AmtB